MSGRSCGRFDSLNLDFHCGLRTTSRQLPTNARLMNVESLLDVCYSIDEIRSILSLDWDGVVNPNRNLVPIVDYRVVHPDATPRHLRQDVGPPQRFCLHSAQYSGRRLGATDRKWGFGYHKWRDRSSPQSRCEMAWSEGGHTVWSILFRNQQIGLTKHLNPWTPLSGMHPVWQCDMRLWKMSNCNGRVMNDWRRRMNANHLGRGGEKRMPPYLYRKRICRMCEGAYVFQYGVKFEDVGNRAQSGAHQLVRPTMARPHNLPPCCYSGAWIGCVRNALLKSEDVGDEY